MKIDYKINNNITIKAYIVNGAILHDILMWVNKVFAHKIYTFLDENHVDISDGLTLKIITKKNKEGTREYIWFE